MAVTYGPGEPQDRWFTNIGGGISFMPLQPSDHAGGAIEATYGSFQTENLSFSAQTGNLGGWETVFAGGIDRANNYYNAPDGFQNPSNNYAYFLKTRKKFDDGDFSVGAYSARSSAYRPLATPVSPIPGVTLAGYNQPGAPFSQQTTGFYSTLPKSVSYKLDTNAINMLYGNLNVQASDDIALHNLTYFVNEYRLHYTPLHDYVPGSESAQEVNRPSSYVLGDKVSADFDVPYNRISVGGFIQASRYHSREQLFNPNLGFVNSPVPVPAGVTASQSAPNGQYFSDVFEQLDTAAFLQDLITPIPTLRITPGIRVINYVTNFYHNEADLFPQAVLYNPGGQLSQFPAARTTFTRAEPSMGVNWQASPWAALYASYARAYRQPENGGGTGPYVALPASAVALERGDYSQGGVKLRWDQIGSVKDVSFDASFSHLVFSNETIPTALASGGALLAFGSSVYNAVNLFGDASPIPDLYVFANAGIVSAHFTNFTNGSGTFHDVPVPNTPNANFNTGLYYKIHTHDLLIQPRASYQYTGAQHLYDNSLNTTSATRLPAYGTVNFSTLVEIPTAGIASALHSVTLTFEVDNLFDKQYNAFEYVSAGGLYGAGGVSNPTTVGAGSVLGLPAPPRAFYLSIGAKF